MFLLRNLVSKAVHVYLCSLTLLLVLLLTGQGLCQTNSTGKHFLWQVASPTHTIYLLGSLILLRKSRHSVKSLLETMAGGKNECSATQEI